MKSIVVSLTLLIFLIVFNTGADAASASLLQAKKDAEAKSLLKRVLKTNPQNVQALAMLEQLSQL